MSFEPQKFFIGLYGFGGFDLIPVALLTAGQKQGFEASLILRRLTANDLPPQPGARCPQSKSS